MKKKDFIEIGSGIDKSMKSSIFGDNWLMDEIEKDNRDDDLIHGIDQTGKEVSCPPGTTPCPFNCDQVDWHGDGKCAKSGCYTENPM